MAQSLTNEDKGKKWQGDGKGKAQIVIPPALKPIVSVPELPTVIPAASGVSPSLKKWCLRKVQVANASVEKWYVDKTGARVPVTAEQSYSLNKDTVVNFLETREVTNEVDDPSKKVPGVNVPQPSKVITRWSAVTYEETTYNYDVKQWVTASVAGWVNDDYLDDYREYESDEFPKSVDIRHQTKSSLDGAQDLTIVDENYDEFKARYNMCGELCVAFIVEKDSETVLNAWRDYSPATKAIYNGKVGRGVDEPLGFTEMQSIFDALIGKSNYEPYKSPSGEKIPLASADPEQRRASEGMQTRLKDYYFITNLKINIQTGDLMRAEDRKECNHWVVVDKITRNGSRLELYNPFPNKRQEYTFGEFYKSVGGDPNTGWWIKRETNPTFARQNMVKAAGAADNSDAPKEEVSEPPKYEVAIDNRTPYEKDAEQYLYVRGESVVKTKLCGEFSVTFILGQSLDTSLRNWMQAQEELKRQDKPTAGLWELASILQAYGFNRRKYLKPPPGIQPSPGKYYVTPNEAQAAASDQDSYFKSFSIDTVLEYWKGVEKPLYSQILGDHNETTSLEDLKTILRAYGYGDDDFSYYRLGTREGFSDAPGRNAETLEKGYFLIAGVNIDGSTGVLQPAGVGHWVVVTKITPRGNLVGGNGGWVELYNPFPNCMEEYSYREFTKSFTGSVFWVKKEITPKFSRENKSSGLTGGMGGGEQDRDGAAEKWKVPKLIAEINKMIANGRPLGQIPNLLIQAGSGFAAAEIARYLPQSDPNASGRSLDVLPGIMESLKVKEIPEEIGGLINKASRGDVNFGIQLTNTLREAGILFIGQKGECWIKDFPPNPDRREDAIAALLESLSKSPESTSTFARQATSKVANLIGTLFARQIIDEVDKFKTLKALKELDAQKKRTAVPKLFHPRPAYRVMWDWEKDDFTEFWRPHLGDPAVFRCGEISNHNNHYFVDLNEAWQFFWFDLCCQIVFGRYHEDLTKDEYDWLANKWTGLGDDERAFNNNHGLDRCRNFVLHERLDSENPKIATIVCGGASLAGRPVPYQKGNKKVWMLEVAHFDGNKPPPPVEEIDPYTDPRVFFATNIKNRPIKPDPKYSILTYEDKTGTNAPVPKTRTITGAFQVNPFPQFIPEAGNAPESLKDKLGQVFHAPVPLIAATNIYYPMKDLVAISVGETDQKPSPYYPTRPYDSSG